jgi:hypothetical protein
MRLRTFDLKQKKDTKNTNIKIRNKKAKVSLGLVFLLYFFKLPSDHRILSIAEFC